MNPPSSRPLSRRDCLARAGALLACVATGPLLRAAAAKKERGAGKIETPSPTKPPLESADVSRLPAGCDRFDLFLLIGQSNMKGRGVMPAEPLRDPRIVMMHLRDDAWYLARHPLHLTGDARTFAGHDKEGTAYFTMGGGCHGCSMSKQTMLEGVQKIITEQVTSISRVRDLTDHASGANPYYR